MKILYFHQHFTTPQGSTGTRSYEMARQLVARGHQVTIVCGSYAMAKSGLSGPAVKGLRRGEVDGIQVVEICLPYSNHDSLLKRSWTFLRFAWRSVWLALREDYDLLFATSTPLTAGIPGMIAKIFRKKTFVFEVRDLWPELPKAMGVVKNPLVLGAMSALEWMSYRMADGCIGLSPGIVEGIQKRGPKGQPVAMIPNGCDLELFQPGNRDDLEVENISSADIVAVFTGAHGMANGLDAVLDAAQVLKNWKRNDIKFLFIGDGKLKPDLIKRSQSKELTNCIFIDPIPKDQLNQLVSRVDLGLMILANVPAFYYGTSPNKFFDYIATGLPVLINYPGWLATIIEEECCGIAIPPEDPVAFAEALIRLADQPNEREEMRRRSRTLAESAFDRHKLAEEFCLFLEARANVSQKRF